MIDASPPYPAHAIPPPPPHGTFDQKREKGKEKKGEICAGYTRAKKGEKKGGKGKFVS